MDMGKRVTTVILDDEVYEYVKSSKLNLSQFINEVLRDRISASSGSEAIIRKKESEIKVLTEESEKITTRINLLKFEIEQLKKREQEETYRKAKFEERLQAAIKILKEKKDKVSPEEFERLLKVNAELVGVSPEELLRRVGD